MKVIRTVTGGRPGSWNSPLDLYLKLSILNCVHSLVYIKVSLIVLHECGRTAIQDSLEL